MNSKWSQRANGRCVLCGGRESLGRGRPLGQLRGADDGGGVHGVVRRWTHMGCCAREQRQRQLELVRRSWSRNKGAGTGRSRPGTLVVPSTGVPMAARPPKCLWCATLGLYLGVTAGIANGRDGCPVNAHCGQTDACPDALRATYAFHWDAVAIVEERAVCVCDTGYAAVTGCRNASRCGAPLRGVHAEVKASGSCAPVLLHQISKLPTTAHQQPPAASLHCGSNA